MKDKLLMILGGIALIAVVIGISWTSLVAGRPMAKYGEETRRQVYQESVTATTACRAEISRLYREWSKPSTTPTYRKAIENMAIEESDRTRCENLSPAVETWLVEISPY